jgi:hypothetical protein
MDRTKTVRNVALIAVIAAAVAFLPGGGRAASAFEAALLVGFGVGFGYIGMRFYREQRISIHSLGDRHRLMLYGGLALVLFEWIARTRMWQTSGGELLWFVLLAFALFALLDVFRRWRSY